MKDRKTPEEMLSNVKRLLEISPHRYKPNDWFFPSDLISFSRSFKYQCARLYKLSLLERHGDGTNRWGYQYRIVK